MITAITIEIMLLILIQLKEHISFLKTKLINIFKGIYMINSNIVSKYQLIFLNTGGSFYANTQNIRKIST